MKSWAITLRTAGLESAWCRALMRNFSGPSMSAGEGVPMYRCCDYVLLDCLPSFGHARDLTQEGKIEFTPQRGHPTLPRVATLQTLDYLL